MAELQIRPLPADLQLKVLEVAHHDTVLVGGQALQFWIHHYDIQTNTITHPDGFETTAISIDTDFLSTLTFARKLQKILNARIQIQSPESRSPLLAEIEVDLAGDSMARIDILHRLMLMDVEEVRAKAIDVDLGNGGTLRVMHPIHVLESRLLNVYHREEKKNEIGLEQLRLAVRATNLYIADMSINGHEVRGPLKLVQRIVRLARTRYGRFAKLNGINWWDAIPVNAIKSVNFKEIRIPILEQQLDRIRPQSAPWMKIGNSEGSNNLQLNRSKPRPP